MVDTARTRAYLVATSLPTNGNREIDAQRIRDMLLSVKHITTASGAPATTPEREGDGYYDSTNDIYYLAMGTSASSDWKQVYPQKIETNHQAGTTYTFVLSDQTKLVGSESASATTFTIPPQSSVTWPDDTLISVIQLGAGTLSIEGGTGVDLNGVTAGSGDINNQYSGCSLLRIGSDDWVASGDIGTVA